MGASHCGISGNERTDHLEKVGGNGGDPVRRLIELED